jgi:hypothetical protein
MAHQGKSWTCEGICTSLYIQQLLGYVIVMAYVVAVGRCGVEKGAVGYEAQHCKERLKRVRAAKGVVGPDRTTNMGIFNALSVQTHCAQSPWTRGFHYRNWRFCDLRPRVHSPGAIRPPLCS